MSVAQGKAMYAMVHTLSQFGDYSVDLIVDKETAKALKGEGVKIKVKGDDDVEFGFTKGDLVAKFKQPEKSKNGRENFVRVVDSKKKDLTDLIGNGSEVKVSYTVADWEFKGRKGTSAFLNAVQVLDLIPYEGKGGGVDEFEEEDGFDSEVETDEFEVEEDPFND